MNENIEIEAIIEAPLTEGKLVQRNDLLTIDPYYDISDYNEALHALENNGIKYREYVSVMTPYNFYLELKEKPIMMNYNMIDSTQWKYLVSKVQPLKQNDEVKLYRRTNKQSNVTDYVNNDAFNRSMKEDYTIIFHYANKEELIRLSRAFGLIYPLGKYINGSKHLAMAFNAQIKNGLQTNNVLLEKKGKQKVGHLEAEINYKVLRNQDKIEKWSMTPKFKDGRYFPTSPMSPLKV